MDASLASYKTKSFIAERDASSIAYEVKRTRAVWDDALSIPGTNRRGGWRCPPGTRYGGQITDRFGRNCGWGVSRRLANEISDLGERLENIGERRQRRREQRAMRRQGRGAGAVERAAGRVARALESTDATPESPRRQRERRGPARQRPNLRLSEQRRMEREIAQPGAPRTDEPRAPRGRRRGNLRMSEERRMEREIVQPGAPRTGERRRRATADVVDKPRPQAARVPAKKQPAKKRAAKKAPAKKGARKKAPAKKATARTVVPNNENRNTPKPEADKPKLSTPKPQSARPKSQPDWEKFAEVDFQNTDAVEEMMDVLRPVYGDVNWLNKEAARINLNNIMARDENYLDGLNNIDIDDAIRDLGARQRIFNNAAQDARDAIEQLRQQFENEPDEARRRNIAVQIIQQGNRMRESRMQRDSAERFARVLEKRKANNPQPAPVVPELPKKPEKALDIVEKKALDDAKKRVSAAIDKNKKILGGYLDERYGEGNAPWKEMTPARIQELVRDANRGDQTAKAALVDWAKQMYSHDKIKGANGKNYKIEVNVSYFNGVISVNGVIRRQKRDGEWSRPIGETRRTINISGSNPDNWEITNYLLKLSYDQDKSAGIATIYNHHAFIYGKAAGIKKASVGSAWDGPYVWGRFGYRSNSPIDVGRMKLELDKFKQGQNALIKNKEEAARITALLNEHKKLNDANVPYTDKRYPRHIDFILALDIPREPKEERKARQAQLKSWFISNMPMGRGVYFFDENNISDDPRS